MDGFLPAVLVSQLQRPLTHRYQRGDLIEKLFIRMHILGRYKVPPVAEELLEFDVF